MPTQSKQFSKNLTEQDILDLVARFLNETQPDQTEVRRIELMLKLNATPLLAYVYEQGYKDGELK